ncbi:MAG: toprim domain-containing protein [bacterium]|nr:toprim domain-containing protein [bacterium]
MSNIEKLTALFSKFPGIGLRQARRFVYFLLVVKGDFLNELIFLLTSLKTAVRECSSCYRFFDPVRSEDRGAATSNGVEENTEANICSLCVGNINKPLLIIVEKDIDLENINKSGMQNSAYFVLGGLFSPSLQNSEVRITELVARVKKDAEKKFLKEIIIALSAHPHGDYTALHVKKTLAEALKKNDIKITTLGRGISTGTEIEYSDAETIKNALDNRK